MTKPKEPKRRKPKEIAEDRERIAALVKCTFEEAEKPKPREIWLPDIERIKRSH